MYSVIITSVHNCGKVSCFDNVVDRVYVVPTLEEANELQKNISTWLEPLQNKYDDEQEALYLNVSVHSVTPYNADEAKSKYKFFDED